MKAVGRGGVAWIPSAALLLSGCVSVVVPPAHPVDPVEVFLSQEGIHSGLVLPRPEGGYVEYGYGDWDWYALNCDRWYHVFDTVLWPTQGALGRRSYAARTAEELRAEARGPALDSLAVSRRDAEGLLRELDARFEATRDTEVYNEVSGMRLVQVPEGFWCCYGCADATSEWLRRLGCSVSCTVIRTRLVVRAPPRDRP